MADDTRVPVPWEWDGFREEAAKWIAIGLSRRQTCLRVGIGVERLSGWMQYPEFDERVREIRAEIRKDVRRHGLAILEERIDTYIRDFQATEVILQQRGDELAEKVAGGETGFIAQDFKGKDADTPVYSFDNALMQARLKIREQLAKELGQWSDKHEVGRPGEFSEEAKELAAVMSLAELEELERRLKALDAPAEGPRQ